MSSIFDQYTKQIDKPWSDAKTAPPSLDYLDLLKKARTHANHPVNVSKEDIGTFRDYINKDILQPALNGFLFVETPQNGFHVEAQSYDKFLSTQIKNPYDSSDQPWFKDASAIKQPAKTYTLNDLSNGSGQKTSPDAVVRLPENFDSTKPINLVVYNHGLYDSAATAYKNANLDEQMRDAPPNSVLVVPEWQAHPGSDSTADGHSSESNHFKNLVNESFAKIAELHNTTLDDIKSIHLISHSAGCRGLQSELYNNGIDSKVNSISVLDSSYSNMNLDPWLHDNIQSLSTGAKRFENIFNPGQYSTSVASLAQVDRIKGWLKESGLSNSNIYEDYEQSGSVIGVKKLQMYSLLFKESDAAIFPLGFHMSLPNLYVHRVVQDK